jgi:cell division protein FtsA
MSKQMIVAGLDLGTNAIKCVIGVRHEDGQIDIIGTGTHPSAGLKQGAVCDQPEAVRSIRAAVEEAELMAGCEIKEVFVSVSGRHFESFNSHGMVRIQSGTVDDDDVAACIDMARAVKLPPDKTILHAVPQEFIIDGKAGIIRPHGVDGVRLEVHTHLIIGDNAAMKALEACIRHAKLRVVDMMLSPLAQAEALLTPQGRDIGVVLVDIGGDTTDIAVFDNGQIIHSAVLAVGGWHVTQDIKGCLNTPTVEAEHLKQTHGCALAELVDADERVEVPGVGGRKRREIERTLLCQIIEARVEEILRMVLDELHQLGYGNGLPGRHRAHRRHRQPARHRRTLRTSHRHASRPRPTQGTARPRRRGQKPPLCHRHRPRALRHEPKACSVVCHETRTPPPQWHRPSLCKEAPRRPSLRSCEKN